MEQARRGPLNWAQHWFWLTDWVLADGDSRGRMMSWFEEFTDGVPVAAVRDALARLVSRHEALRTVYRTDDDGLPIQVVLDEVAPRVILVDLGATWSEHVPHRFDLANEPSLTAVAGVRDGRVYRLDAAVHRMVVDGAAWALVQEQCRALVDGAEATAGPGWQPIDQAGTEVAARTSGAAERSARYWETELSTGPHASLPVYWDGGGAPSIQTSTPVPRAKLDAIAKRYEVTAPTVAEALLAVMCAGWTGHLSCAIGSVTANRVRKPARSSVGRYASMVRVILQVDRELTFQSFVQSVHRRLVVAYKYGAHDVGEMTMREARHSARIGARIISSIFFEYHHYAQRDRTVGEPAPPSTPVRQQEIAGHVPQLRFDVLPAGDIVHLAIRCCSRLLDRDGAKEFLTQFRELVDRVGNGDRPVDQLLALVHLPAPWAVGNWASIRQAWINLDDVSRLLMEHPDVATATVSDCAGELVAQVVSQSASLTASDLDEHMREVVSDHPSAMVPQRYVITPAPGSPARETPPLDGREAALMEVFRACHGGGAPELADTYAQAGGEFFRIPDMLDGLERASFTGISWNDFIGFAPMRTLAAKLTTQ